MARCNKAKEANVMGRLSNIAYRSDKKTFKEGIESPLLLIDILWCFLNRYLCLILLPVLHVLKNLQSQSLSMLRSVKETGIFHSRSTPFLHLQPAWQTYHEADLINKSKAKVTPLAGPILHANISVTDLFTRLPPRRRSQTCSRIH